MTAMCEFLQYYCLPVLRADTKLNVYFASANIEMIRSSQPLGTFCIKCRTRSLNMELRERK